LTFAPPRLPGDVEAVHGGLAGIGLEQHGHDLHHGGLARFEPSRAKMLPRATSKSTPRNTSSSEYDFVRPWMRIAGS
jgi:hypothetical protein